MTDAATPAPDAAEPGGGQADEESAVSAQVAALTPLRAQLEAIDGLPLAERPGLLEGANVALTDALASLEEL